MKKKLEHKLWQSFIDVLGNPNTTKNFESYYSSIVSWIRENSEYFTVKLLQRNRLDILMSLEPLNYVIDKSDILLELELIRFEKNKPSNLDTLAMIIGDRLWDMVTIKSGKNCPNCKGDELRYLLVLKSSSEEQNIILECESCAWIENIDGTKWNEDEDIVSVTPANKEDLKRFGID